MNVFHVSHLPSPRYTNSTPPGVRPVSKVQSAETANALEFGYELPPGQLLHPWGGFPVIAVEMCSVDFEVIMLIHRY